jgi:hypothetical protein
MMRQFLEDNLRRAERRVREAERHMSRQKAVVARFEALGEEREAQIARERLAVLGTALDAAKDVLKRQPAKRPLVVS